jgi:N-acetylneuraminic acid mutarotase
VKKKRTAQSALFNPGVLLTLLVWGAVCFIIGGSLLAFSRSEEPTKVSQRTLTFAERVAYQRAIEEVYWRHRIWPKANAGAKPPLDRVMPQEAIEKKVEDYLRNSQVLKDYWQRPIAADQLQAEMDRMAKHTKQLEVLRELFEALGNDPFVIAECLAKPILSERLKPAIVARRKEPLGARRARAEDQMPKAMATVSANYILPVMAGPSDNSSATVGCFDDKWTPTRVTSACLTTAPDARADHTAVWTGSEMIVWGGSRLNTGGRYNPSTDSWTATSTTNAPAGRDAHTAVWTGSEMIIWGGVGQGDYLNTGARYNPSTDSWTITSASGAPTARTFHTAVWTGSQMIVWGGYSNGGYLNTGGRYNPSTDSWTTISTVGAPAGRYAHTVVWAGSQMIVWGGVDVSGYLNTGGRYSPTLDSWVATSLTNAFAARGFHTAVCTGNQMIVWSGYNGASYLNTGSRYNPSVNSWTATSTANAPAGRSEHTAVWAASQMIVWGGDAGFPNFF